MKLAGYSFRNANLSRADFSDADIVDTDFSGTNLSFTTFKNAIVNNSNFTTANMRTANLEFIQSAGVIGMPASMPSGWVLQKGVIVGRGARVKNADLNGAVLKNLDLSGIEIVDTDISRVDFAGSMLVGAKSSRLTGVPKALPIGWKIISGYLIGENAVIEGGDFADVSFEGADFSGIEFRASVFSEVASGSIKGTPARLPAEWVLEDGYLFGPGAVLQNAKITDISLTGINLDYASFMNATLSDVTFSNVSLRSVDFKKSKLTRVAFRNSDMANSTVSGAKLVALSCSGTRGMITYWPTGWGLQKGFCLGPSANLNGVGLAGVNLNGVNLSNAVLDGVSSGSVYGKPLGLPPGWKLVKGYLVGPGADLRNADLQYADLSMMQLMKARFDGANLTGAKLTLSDLSGATFVNTTIQSTRFGFANLSSVVIQSVTARNSDFTSARLDRGSLRDSTLSMCNITGLSLNKTLLVNLRTDGLTGQPFGLNNHFRIYKGYLLGPKMILKDIDLSRSNLIGINLQEADLSGASFYSANLTGANLKGASTLGTDFSKAQLRDVVCPDGSRAHTVLGCEGKHIQSHIFSPNSP